MRRSAAGCCGSVRHQDADDRYDGRAGLRGGAVGAEWLRQYQLDFVGGDWRRRGGARRAIWLAITTGQGGSRLGGNSANATDRMDDRYWKLGGIYVNSNDPAIFVERRIGLGWTINFGNPRALLVMLVILALPFAFTAFTFVVMEVGERSSTHFMRLLVFSPFLSRCAFQQDTYRCGASSPGLNDGGA